MIEVSIDRLRPNPYQVRLLNDTDPELQQLKDSINKSGLIEPIIVRPTADGFWEIAAGHRRALCYKLLGIPKIACIQRRLSDEQMCESILDENLKRQSLNSIDEAKAYQNLKLKFSWSEEKTATRFHVSRDIVAQRIRLLSFLQPIQDLVAKGQLGVSHAEAIATAPKSMQLGFSQIVIEKGLSVKETTEMAKQLVELERANEQALLNIGSIVAGFDRRIGELERTSTAHQLAVNWFDFHSYPWKTDYCAHNVNSMCDRYNWSNEPSGLVQRMGGTAQFKKLEDGKWHVQASSTVCSHCDLFEPRPVTGKT